MRLDELLNNYLNLIQLMANKVRQMFILSEQAIRNDDKVLSLRIIEMDDFINHYEEEINQKAVELLSLMQPVARDLRTVIAGIQMSIDLERLGDYNKSIARYVIKNDPVSQKLMPYIEKLFKEVIANYDKAILAIKDNNPELAYEIPIDDERVDQALNELINFIEDESKVDSELRAGYYLMSMIRNLERAGDHTKNLAESVIYRVKGQHIDFG